MYLHKITFRIENTNSLFANMKMYVKLCKCYLYSNALALCVVLEKYLRTIFAICIAMPICVPMVGKKYLQFFLNYFGFDTFEILILPLVLLL